MAKVIPLQELDDIYKVPVGDYVIQLDAEDQYVLGLRSEYGDGFRIIGYFDEESEAFNRARQTFNKRHDKSAKIWWEKGHGSERRLEAVEKLRQSNPHSTKVHEGLRVVARSDIRRSQGGRDYFPVRIVSGTSGTVVTANDRSITVVFDAPEGNAIQWTGPDKEELFWRDVRHASNPTKKLKRTLLR